MQNLIKKMVKRPFVRNVILLMSGTAAAQIITLASTPFITRIYGPEAFGILGTFNSIISIVVPIAALTFPIAIVLPDNDQDSKGIIKLSLVTSLIVAMITLFLILIFNERLVNLLGLHDIATYLYLIPIAIVLSALMQVTQQWLIRNKKFSINAKVSLFHSLIINMSKIGIGLLKPYAAVLVIIQTFTEGIKAFLMMFFSKRSYKKVDSQFKNKKEKSLLELAKEYYDFPVFRAPQVLLNGFSMSLPILMLTAFFGPATAGYYTLCRTALSAPTQLIGKSVSDVFYPRISEAARKKEDVTAMVMKATLSLAVLGLIPFGLIIIYGPTIFTFIFGEDWTTAGEYARWVGLWVFCGFINRPSVMTLPVLSAQAHHLVFTIVMLVSNAAMLFIGYYFYSSDLTAIKLVGISEAVSSIFLVFMTLFLSKKR